MSAQILYLFPDTNLFVQCRPLGQLDWSPWNEFDEIHLLVSRPVQSEIDNQKNKGSDRLGRKARAASSLFREIIIGSNDYEEVRPSGPAVKLFIRPELKPSADIAESLDYRERDDQLVGTAYAFKLENSGLDVRLLTHDTGPMATAKMVGLAVLPVPDEWLVPPESTDAERKINALESELARLKKAEPEFRIACLGHEGKEVRKIELEPVQYEPVSEEEGAELMARIVERYPLVTEFGPREPAEREAKMPGLRLLGMKEFFTPASDKDITAYRDEKYPEWLSSCKDFLRNYHKTQQRRAGQPTFTFIVSNDGARPAKDALITFEAKGNFEIMPPPPRDRDERKERASELSKPPAPPSGKWQTGPSGQRHLLDALERMQGSYASILNPHGRRDELLRAPILPNFNSRRDQNAFYYKPHRPMLPEAEFSLDCEQWRHGIEPEAFYGEIHFASEEREVAGALECRVHAENLADLAKLVVPVRIKVRRVRSYEAVKELVDSLILRPPSPESDQSSLG